MDTDGEFLHKELTGEIIAAAYDVHNGLGCGLLEKVYENALVRELGLRKRRVSSQKEFRVVYKGEGVGSYYADLVVEEKVMVEVKAVDKISSVHRAQLLNYLRISGLRVGLIVNFARPRLKSERLVV